MRTFSFTLVCHTKPTLGSTGSANYDRVFCSVFFFFFWPRKGKPGLVPSSNVHETVAAAPEFRV